jgi:hypothetical protein
MTDYLIVYLKTLVLQAEPLTAFGAAHGFAPVEKGGQDDDEEDYCAHGGEDFGVVDEGEEIGVSQGASFCLDTVIFTAS